ncbi:YjcQ family protein [Streptococcus suis]|uniref:YjcQ family protein n=1 Tax=Streptococcus suis TaxID=1307 RepID=UPI000CF4EFDD|nr:YjcQ family protein [Streptococcus suis]
MARDDYHVIIYQILSYLYQQLKRGKEIDVKMLVANGTLFQINENYYMFIIESLLSEGLIAGPVVDETMSGKFIDGLESTQITVKGIEYLMDNTFLNKAKRFLKDVKEVTPFI